MSCPLVINGPSCQPSFSVQESSDPLGSLTRLSDGVVIQILSYLPQPKEVSFVCHTMSVLAKQAIEVQLHDKGLCTETLSKKWEKTITPECLSLLLQFHVDVPALALKDKEMALQELDLLLDKHLDLLHNPNELKKFLQDRLLENVLMLVEGLYPQEVVQEVRRRTLVACETRVAAMVSSVRAALSRIFGGTSNQMNFPGFSERMKAVIDFLREQGEGQIEVRGLMANGMQEVTYAEPDCPILPVRIFALLPFELLQMFRDDQARRRLLQTDREKDGPSLMIGSASIVPMGISSLEWVEHLSVFSSETRSLPEEIGKMKLRLLWLSDCPNLYRLPVSVAKMSFLQDVVIHRCPKLRSDHLVIQELAQKGVCIHWREECRQ